MSWPSKPLLVKPVLTERFWTKVKISAGCWEWQAARISSGYGEFWLDGKMHLSHRLVYEALIGPIAPGMEIDHLCRNHACSNPAHLEVVTPRQNSLRGTGPSAENAQKTHCPNGHEYAGPNLYVTSKGHRQCRACHRATENRRRLRLLAA